MGKTGPTIALIDDDESVRRALGRLLRSAGLEVEAYASAEEYLGSRGPSTPDCLVLDVRMTGMSGLELQRQLASSGRCVPVVFITAHEDEQARRVALGAGAVDFLRKPFDDRILLDAVAKALAGGRVSAD